MKLSDWAKKNGLSYRTAWRLFKQGKLPVPVHQLETGTILVEGDAYLQNHKEVVIYARVSSHDQKEDLNRQVARLSLYAADHKLHVGQVVTEVASGMNGKRKKFIHLLEQNTVKCILVEHKDRVTRFGFDFLNAYMGSTGRSIVVLESDELKGDKNDLVIDMIDILTSFCARLYGKRSAENRAKKALKFLESSDAEYSSH